MAISMNRYVDIKSGINNLQSASEKDLIARIFSANAKLPVGSILEFDSLKNVGTFFGTTSDEYKVAQKYFNFISKYQTQPKKISYSSDFRAGVSAFILGTQKLINADLATLKAITAGTFDITVNGTTKTISSIDLSSCADLSAVATAIDTALASESVSVDCTYDNTDSVFKFALSTTAATGDTLAVSTSDLTNAMKISEAYNPVVSEGAVAGSSIESVLTTSYAASNNFASFAFISALSEQDITDIANWNKDNHPTEFMFVAQVNAANYATIFNNVKDIDGVSLELCDNTNEGKLNFVIPMAITATTDYDRENGTQLYMYNQFDDAKVIVTTDTDADNYDTKKVNYYGQTQQAGQKLAFYQRGVMQGNYQDQNIYVNEIWLKDALTTKFINYMLATPNWYYNKAGQAIGNALAQDVIDRAKINGTITTEKELTQADKAFIYKLTNDENAWRQVYMEGYYFMSSISKETINNQTTYKYNYTLIYSKGDSIKKVEGKDILI